MGKASPGDHTRAWFLPIRSVDFYIEEGDFGYSVYAKIRPDAKSDEILTSIVGPTAHMEPLDHTCVFTTRDSVKVQRLLRAFNHLAELESGRKELF